jgi:hypothetical protein
MDKAAMLLLSGRLVIQLFIATATASAVTATSLSAFSNGWIASSLEQAVKNTADSKKPAMGMKRCVFIRVGLGL